MLVTYVKKVRFKTCVFAKKALSLRSNKKYYSLMNKRIICVFLLFTTAIGMKAQSGRMFTPDYLLSNSLVNDLMQDSNGFVWIATQDGLNRYDSNRMTVFHKGDGSNLGSNDINCVFESSRRVIYVGTRHGAQTFDSYTNTFRSVTSSSGQPLTMAVSDITERSNGDILLSTASNGVLVIPAGKACCSANPILKNRVMRTTVEDSRRRLWLATHSKGLYLLDGQQQRHFFDGRLSTIVLKVVEDMQGNIYAATMTDGLYIYNNVSRQFEHLPTTTGMSIFDVCVQPDGTFLIGTDGDGLKVFNPITRSVTSNLDYVHEIDISRAKVHAVIKDRENNLWLGLFQKGVYMLPATDGSFGYIGHKSSACNVIGSCYVMSVFCDSQGILWVGTDNDGIYGIDSHGRQVAHHLPSTTVLAIGEAAGGNLWIGTYNNGCGLLNRRTGDYNRLSLPSTQPKDIFALCTDHQHRLWLATLGDGLLCYDHSGGHCVRMKSPRTGVASRHDNFLINNYLLSLALSRDGRRLYIGTCDGLACYDIQHKSFVSSFGRNCIIDSNSIYHICETSDGLIWVGTPDGLYKVSARGKVLRHYTVADGLPNNTVRSICNDNNGGLWLGTNRGLSCLDIKNDTFCNYSVGDGLQGNEFSDRAVCVIPNDSLLLFGGANGLTWFNPLRLRTRKKLLRLQLVSMSVGEQPVVKGMCSGAYQITDTAVIAAGRFELAHEARAFTLRFSAMEYATPEQVMYEYCINDGGWISLGNGCNDVTFSSLSSGTYHFRVRARIGGTMSEERRFTIVIHPVWYASWWAVVVYVLLAVCIILWYARHHRSKVQAKLRLQEFIHAEQLTEAKIQFFMNISHEIRTPMTLVVSPLKHLILTDSDPERQRSYRLMERNTERIMSLINQLMDIRKIDKGMMPMNFRATDICRAVNDVFSLFSGQAVEKRINYTMTAAARPTAWVDRSGFEKILMNVLSNAFKNTPNGGDIGVTVECGSDSFLVSIANSGKHIPEDRLERIFDRFYQITGGSSSYTGTGIGLHLTRQLCKLHHGTITAHNTGQGCRFDIEIPLHNADAVETDDAKHIAPPGSEMKPALRVSKKKRIMVVDDDDEICRYLVEELSKDYVVSGAVNGKIAFEQILRDMPDLVISDIMMPEIDGITLCQKLKHNINTNHIPVVLLTAKNAEEDRLQGIDTGADAYIVKPFSIDVLRKTVGNLIRSRQLLRNKFSGKESQEERVASLDLQSPDEQLLERIMKVLNKHIADPNLNVEFVASEVGISRAHLHRKLKELTNQSPRDFIRNIRLKQAATLLTKRGQNVTEVMYAVGIQNAASFSTMFKSFYGVSPKEYVQEYSTKS